MHSVQFGLLRLAKPNEEMTKSDSDIADMIYELNGKEGNQWSDWCEVGGRWSDMFEEERFSRHVWPNKMEHSYMIKVNEENLDLVIESLTMANEWREQEFTDLQTRFKGINGKELVNSLLDTDVTLEKLLFEVNMSPTSRDLYLNRYLLRTMLSFLEGDWIPDSKFFYYNEHIMNDGEVGWESILTNPIPVKNLLTDPETRSEMLKKLDGYYIVLMDFHY